jgi:hypothetical protein
VNTKPIITLEEAITTLREWLSHHSSNTLEHYEFLFRKLIEEQNCNPTLNDLEVVASFYERHLQVPAYLKSETKTGILKARKLLRVVSLLRGQQIPLKFIFRRETGWYSEIENEYSRWILSTHKTLNTIRTRTGRIKTFVSPREASPTTY